MRLRRDNCIREMYIIITIIIVIAIIMIIVRLALVYTLKCSDRTAMCSGEIYWEWFPQQPTIEDVASQWAPSCTIGFWGSWSHPHALTDTARFGPPILQVRDDCATIGLQDWPRRRTLLMQPTKRAFKAHCSARSFACMLGHTSVSWKVQTQSCFCSNW